MTKYEPVFWDIETTSVNPIAQHWHHGHSYDARVTCIGIATLSGWRDSDLFSGVEYNDRMLHDADEYVLLEVARDRMQYYCDAIREKGKVPFIVGWNSRFFDHPYFSARAGSYRIDPGPIASQVKRLDMMEPAAQDCGKAGYAVSQDDYANRLGIDVIDDTDGSDMPEFFDNGEMDKIVYHCREDIKVMCNIFVQEKEMFMDYFFDHYDIMKDAVYPVEV